MIPFVFFSTSQTNPIFHTMVSRKKNYNVISSIFLMAYPGGFLWSHTIEGPLVPNATDFGYQF